MTLDEGIHVQSYSGTAAQLYAEVCVFRARWRLSPRAATYEIAVTHDT